ncbi:ATP-binding cassette domain-containing protein [Nocardioides sp. MAH-18]|uniref:ATP-binding cassette domain-containing protein n=1 Tax=Nocardioides agri TaxID=2682843 RepID=A0A6L6XPB9_9ACTN|nr:ATP-binding cassette domain-containing protein [Nocardioides sp. CGMCC 1.13656]MBA2953817.1 ABC transporter ATP-binding protein [Nocardioides sp. CGMCC 1.13656]MVQ48682.1 ATP-binding cassette domain-containing protein [Nocardioides sp. MAH-18]
MTALLEVEDLCKTYRAHGHEVAAASAVSFRLEEGGSLGIVGESGSGKTTTARMVVGLERPDSGRIVFRGQELSSRPRGRSERLERARAIQIVFQDPYLSLDPRVAVGAAVEQVVKLHTKLAGADRRRRVLDLLGQVGLGEREAGTLPRRLSGGQRQRVAIARALAVGPAVLVLDEAVSALDVSVQAQVLNLLTDIRELTGVGLLFISHDLAVVRYVCDEALVMRSGEVVERGSTAQLLSAPQHAYTRVLLDAIPRPA